MGGDLDVDVEQGGDWRPVWRWSNDDGVPVDLTGYSARLQFRSTYDSAIVLLELVSGVGIALGADGSIQPVALAAETAELEYDSASLKYRRDGRTAYEYAVWDLVMTSPIGEVTKLLAGTVFLLPGVTR